MFPVQLIFCYSKTCLLKKISKIRQHSGILRSFHRLFLVVVSWARIFLKNFYAQLHKKYRKFNQLEKKFRFKTAWKKNLKKFDNVLGEYKHDRKNWKQFTQSKKSLKLSLISSKLFFSKPFYPAMFQLIFCYSKTCLLKKNQKFTSIPDRFFLLFISNPEFFQSSLIIKP